MFILLVVVIIFNIIKKLCKVSNFFNKEIIWIKVKIDYIRVYVLLNNYLFILIWLIRVR